MSLEKMIANFREDAERFALRKQQAEIELGKLLANASDSEKQMILEAKKFADKGDIQGVSNCLKN